MANPKLDPYLNFNGNCAEAFKFYEKLLGGKIDMMMTFGGSPIDGTTATTHTHTVSGNLVTTAEGVAGLSNGAATGYAQNGTYPFSAASSDGDVGLPSVHLKQCQKN